jgi:pilus assembly protein Flp/PilA
MKNLFALVANDESGATAIEYGLIATLISLAIIAGVSNVGETVPALFNMISTKVSAVTK